jgi:hypothetical protein
MRKSLFAVCVIAATAIAPMVVLKKHVVRHWPVRLKSINKAARVVLIMLSDSNAFANKRNRK